MSTKVTSENYTDLAWVIPVNSSEVPVVTQGDSYIFNRTAEDISETVINHLVGIEK